ncbi:MAG TPA: response regulator [Nitrospiraceae bacterium]|nr:response regulator [Nitrospiraceae bacterium]
MRPKILIVDDSVDSWNLLSTIVKSHDFYPVWAADGMQAMAAARFHQPQAILLDLGLPDVDGLLILQRLKNDHSLRDIPVIVVTVCARQEAEEKARQLGAVAYVSKPVQADELMASIQTVLGTQVEAPAGATS